MKKMFMIEYTMNCICQKNDSILTQFEKIKCNTCNNYQHKKCVKDNVYMENYECYLCQLKNMDFKINILQHVIHPHLLENNRKKFLCSIPFKLNQNDISRLQKEHDIFFFVRCLRLDNVGYENKWPLNCNITINGKTTFEFQFKKNPPRKMREDFPLIFYLNEHCNYFKIEQYKFLDFFNLDQNNITISCFFDVNDDDKYHYSFSAEFIRIFNNYEEIISRIPLIEDLKEITKRIRGNNNDNIMIFEEKIHLTDIYNRNVMIQLPARSINCKHISVFDVRSYLFMNSLSKHWNCPICRKKCVRIYIDYSLLKVIKENNFKLNEIIFNYNQFKYFVLKNEKNSEQINEVIDLISEESIIQQGSNALPNENNNLNPQESIQDISSYFKKYEDLDKYEIISEDKEVQLSLKQLIHFDPNININDSNDLKSIVPTKKYVYKENSFLSHKRRQYLFLE